MKKILLSTVAIAAFISNASAQEPGNIYIRGDVGYQINKYLNAKPKGFRGDIGLGYVFSESVRADVTLNFSNPSTKFGADKLKIKGIDLMFNGYYDFNNSSDFTPYLMAGIGVDRSSMEIGSTKSKKLTSPAYQFGIGVGYEAAKNVHLDVGYKLSGKLGTYKLEDGRKWNRASRIINSITTGIRFAF